MTVQSTAAAQGCTGTSILQDRVATLFSDIELEDGAKTDRDGVGRGPKNFRVTHNFVHDSKSESKNKQIGYADSP